MLPINNKSIRVHKVQDWLVLQEFYELVYKARLLLVSIASFEDMRESKQALDEMIDFLVKKVLEKRIEPDDLDDYELHLNYRKIQPTEGYNENYYDQLMYFYKTQAELFNYIIDGRYRQFFIKKNPTKYNLIYEHVQ